MHFEARGLRIIARLWRSRVNFLLTIPEDIQGDLPDTVTRIYCTLFVIQKCIWHEDRIISRSKSTL